MDGISKRINAGIKPEKAFQKFVNEFNEWWPGEYTWSQNKLQEIKIDAGENGLCTEIGPHGFRCDWGRITELVENKKIRLKWQISFKREPVPDPDRSSDIKVEFIDNGTDTTLVFEHINFKNHGEGYEDYRNTMNSEYGWDYILNRFKTYCEEHN